MAKGFYGGGSIYYDDKNKIWTWAKMITLPSGERVRKKITRNKKTDLTHAVEEFLLTLEDKKVVGKQVSVATWIKKYLEIFVKPATKQRTYENYRERLAYCYPYIGKRSLDSVTTMDIQKMLNDLAEHGGLKKEGLSAETINCLRRQLRTAFGVACKNGLIAFNPVAGTTPLRRVKKEAIALSEEQVLKLLEVAKAGDYIYYGANNPKCIKCNAGTKYMIKNYFNLVNLAFATGMRIGELRGLTWSCVNFSQNLVTVKQQIIHTADKGEMIDEPKTLKSKRKIIVDKDVMNELRDFKYLQSAFAAELGDQFKNEEGFVFTNTFGSFIDVSNFRDRYFNKMLRVAGIPEGFTIHCMRHTHATLLLKNGVNLKVVSERLGHSSVNVTINTYAHVIDTMEQTASNTWGSILQSKENKLKEDKLIKVSELRERASKLKRVYKNVSYI